ncbi:MAG: EamA family transporter [Verrucomicrobia bacterium]|nr:EamA family transporter [Verrucomicrobiota bacterium]
MQTSWLRSAGVASLALVPGIIWGASFLFIAESLAILPPMGVTFARVVLGFGTLALFPSARRPIERADWPMIALLGLVWLAFPLSMFPLAERHVSSGLAGLLNGGTPIFAVAFAALLAGRWPARGAWIALVVGVAGLLLISIPTLGEGDNAAFSVGLILAAVASYGLAINLAIPLQRRYGALPVIWRALGVAVALTAPLGLPALGEFQWALKPFLCLLSLGVLGTAVANVLAATLAGRYGANAGASVTFILPIVAMLLGVGVRGETLSPWAVLGGLVCLSGAWLLARAPRADTPASARTPPPETAVCPASARSTSH